MPKRTKPIVLLSKCLAGGNCRWDGDRLYDDGVRSLKGHIRFLPVCPEMEIGMPVPRDRIQLIRTKSQTILYQPETDIDMTEKMTLLGRRYAQHLSEVDGLLFKAKSPSCGVGSSKLFSESNKIVSRSGTGLFAREILARFPKYPVADESDLANPENRHNWLCRIFLLAEARSLGKIADLSQLQRFHQRNQMLLETYSKKVTAELAELIAKPTKKLPDRLAAEYRLSLHDLLSRKPKTKARLTALVKALDFYSSRIDKAEISQFKVRLCRFEAGDLFVATVLKKVRVWAVRYDKSFVRDNTFFSPYPDSLA